MKHIIIFLLFVVVYCFHGSEILKITAYDTRGGEWGEGLSIYASKADVWMDTPERILDSKKCTVITYEGEWDVYKVEQLDLLDFEDEMNYKGPYRDGGENNDAQQRRF